MSKQLLLLVICFVVSISCFAQNTWIKNFGSTQFEYFDAITTDDSGNVYVAGRMAASMTIGDTTIPKVGGSSYSYFLAKFTTNGNFVWVRGVNVAPNIELVGGLTVDKQYNVYMSISDPGTLFKFDKDGTQLYKKTIQSWKPRLGNVLVDDSNNVWICGSFSQYNFSLDGLPTMPHHGGTSLYIAKLDTAGTARLVIPIGCNSISARMGKIALRDSLVYVTANGHFDVYIKNDTFTNANIITACFNQKGDYKWARKIFPNTSTSLEHIFDIVVTSQHQVVIGGLFYNPINVSGTVLSNANNRENFFMASYHPNGNLKWAKQSNSIYSSCNALALTPDDKIAVAVDYSFGFAFGGQAGGDGVSNKRYALMMSVDENGNASWIKTLGQSDWTYANAIAVDKQGNWYMGGQFQSTTTNTIDGNALRVVGEADAYFIKNFYLPPTGGASLFNFCKDGKPTQLTASGNGVKWYADSLLTQQVFAGTNFTVQFDSAVTYYVIQTQGGARSAAKKVTAFLFDLTPVSLLKNGDTLMVNSNKGKQYKWYKNGALLSGKTSQNLLVTSSGNYHAVMTDSNGCTNYTDTLNMQVVGLAEANTIDLNIYPNPAHEVIYFEGNYSVNEVSFYNTSGNLIKLIADKSIQSCSIKDLPNGLYMVKIATKQGTTIKRIMVIHQ